MRGDFAAIGDSSPEEISWFRNNNHHSVESGRVVSYSAVGNVKFGNNGASQSQTIAIARGREGQVVTTSTTPYIDRIRFRPSPWLMYNAFSSTATMGDFTVEFHSSGAWAGEGSVRDDVAAKVGTHSHTTTDENVIKRTNKRISW